MSEENEQFIDGVLQDSLTRRELATLYSHSADAVIRLEKITRKQSKQIRDYEAALEVIYNNSNNSFVLSTVKETLAKWKAK